MIQAVADDEERGALGMHYTSVPNILKVLNPLFLDDLREKLSEAGTNSRKLLNLRNRMARIRVFRSGLRVRQLSCHCLQGDAEIEAEINKRRGEKDRRTDIHLTNFRGIELRDFPSRDRPLSPDHRRVSVRCAVSRATGSPRRILAARRRELDYLRQRAQAGLACALSTHGKRRQAERRRPVRVASRSSPRSISKTKAVRPTYVAIRRIGAAKWQTKDQKADLEAIFEGRTKNWKSLDYVSGWFVKAADYGTKTDAITALVSTNSICQGPPSRRLWPLLFDRRARNVLRSYFVQVGESCFHNAGVTVVIVGISNHANARRKRLYSSSAEGSGVVRDVDNINPYLVPAPNFVVQGGPRAVKGRCGDESSGTCPTMAGTSSWTRPKAMDAIARWTFPDVDPSFMRPFIGSQEFIRGLQRRCIWVEDDKYEAARSISWLKSRFEAVRKQRSASKSVGHEDLARVPFRFGEVRQSGLETAIVVPASFIRNRTGLSSGYLASRYDQSVRRATSPSTTPRSGTWH